MRETGLAAPLLMLLFGSGFLFPLIAALVSGDIIANEDQNGTLKTILTRSVDRGQMFAGKLLAAAIYTIAGLFTAMLTALVAGDDRLGAAPARHAVGHARLLGRGPQARPASPTWCT